MAQIVSPITGKTVDSINIDAVMGMLAADLVQLIAGADISFRYPEMERTYGEYGAIIKEGRIPPAEGRSVNTQTTQLCAPSYFDLDSRVYDNWLESVYPSEIRRVDITKLVTDQASYEDLLRRTAERNIEGYRAEVNRAIDAALSGTIDSGGINSPDRALIYQVQGEVGMYPGGYLTNGTRYEYLVENEETGEAPSFAKVWSEILAVYFDMLVENSTYTEGDNVYGARREDLVVYVPHKFLAYSDITYIQKLFNERGLDKLPEIRTHNGGVLRISGQYTDDSNNNIYAILILDKRVLNHVTRFMEAGSHDVDCRKSTVFDLHVEHMIKYAPFYKAYAILCAMPKN